MKHPRLDVSLGYQQGNTFRPTLRLARFDNGIVELSKTLLDGICICINDRNQTSA